MAPEQAVGDVVDHRTDLYAWGLLVYELLTGTHPFGRHTTPQTLIAAHLTEPPPPFDASHRVPPALAALVMQCLEKDPARRPDSAAAVLARARRRRDDSRLDKYAPGSRSASPHRRQCRSPRGCSSSSRSAHGWRAAANAAKADAAPAEESLAVLPLANLSGDKADDYFGIGLAEEITRALAKNGVRVIGRVSAATLQAKGLDERAIAKELGVTSLLTGAVQRACGQLRINMTLVSATDGAVRWTEKYDRPISNVFAVQDEIARTVATTLLGSLRRKPDAGAARAETSDPEAHALFLQGQLLFNRRGAPALRQAIALFEQASARDPRYARAQASLAMTLAVLPAYVQDSTTPLVTSAVAAAQRAIAMDSTISGVIHRARLRSFAAGRDRDWLRRASGARSRWTRRWPPRGGGTGCSPTDWATSAPRTNAYDAQRSSSRRRWSPGPGRRRSCCRSAGSPPPTRSPATRSRWTRRSCWPGLGARRR